MYAVYIPLWNYKNTKLLQKSEMRKNMVMDLIYRGFIYAAVIPRAITIHAEAKSRRSYVTCS